MATRASAMRVAAKKGLTVVKRPAYSPHGSVVNAQLKAKVRPLSSSNLGKFLCITDPPRSEISNLISDFIRVNNRQNRGAKKSNAEEKLRAIAEGKRRVGIPEIAKVLSGQSIKTAPASSS